MTLPNFFIIGANKAGTTSLFYYLRQHPQIYMSLIKEPMYFIVEDISCAATRPDAKHLNILVDNINDYSALFDKVTNEKAIGEASTAYLPNPNVPERIKTRVPHAKFIAILRNPADRAYSAFTFNIQEGIEPLTDFSLAIEEEWKPGNWRHYVKLGFYHDQVKRYLDTFGHSKIKVYLYEDLRSDPVSLLKSIFQFLEVDDSFIPNISEEHNVTLIPQYKTLHTLLTGLNTVTSKYNIYPKENNKGLFDSFIKFNLEKPPKLHKDARKELIEVYREDILKLQDLIKRDLSMWLV